MRLILISLDACSQQDANTLLSLPNLGRLAENGVFCDRVQTIYPTITYPAHASIITGCYPQKHGIAHNQYAADGSRAKESPWYWDEKEIQVSTLFQVAAEAGREVATLLWPTTGHSKSIRYNFPEVIALQGENQALKVLRYGSAGWLLKSEIRFGSTRRSYQQPDLDRYATLLSEQLIYKQYSSQALAFRNKEVKPSKKRMQMHMPDVLALHLVDCDAMRHQYGTNSAESQSALVRLDQNVGRLMRALRSRYVMEDTIIAVVSDHGQSDFQDVVCINDILQRDHPHIRARTQSLGFGAYIRCERADSSELYAFFMRKKEEFKLSHVYHRSELKTLHAPEDVYLAVEAKTNVQILDYPDEEPDAATHGFGIHHPQAKTLLWLYGPPFKKQTRLSDVNLVDIAPTLAYAIGLSLDEAQGRVLYEAFS